MVERRPLLPLGFAAVLLFGLTACGDAPVLSDGLGFAAGEAVPEVDLRVRVTPQQVALLDPIEVEVSLWLRDGLESEFEPTIPAGFAGEVPAAEEMEPLLDQGTWSTWRFELRAVELGEQEVGPWTARASRAVDGSAGDTAAEVVEASSEPVVVTVGGVLAETLPEDVAAEAIEPPAELFSPRFPWVEILVGGAVVLLLLGGLLLWLLRRGKRAPRAAIAVEVPAHVEALRALARLRTAPRGTEAEIDAFYVAVSDVLRRYLERRFGLHAPERTTEEFLPELERSGFLAGEQRRHLARFLEQCDLVKFAGVRPGDDVHVQTFDFAEELVHATRADKHSVTANAAAPAPAEVPA